MFGNPNWFRLRKKGWGVWPTSWQGWGYALLSPLAVAIPSVAFLAINLIPEAIIWLVVSALGLLLDVNSVVRKKRTKADLESLYYIGDQPAEPAADSTVSTENYELRLRG